MDGAVVVGSWRFRGHVVTVPVSQSHFFPFRPPRTLLLATHDNNHWRKLVNLKPYKSIDSIAHSNADWNFRTWRISQSSNTREINLS